MILDQMPEDWKAAIADELAKPSASKLEAFLEDEYANQTIYPPLPDLFNALRLTPLANVRVLLLGQDPYHNDVAGVPQAHGLAFSVRPPVPPPPSLVNMYKERQTDVGIPPSKTGNLEPWAKQGVLMLNSILTTRAHQAAAHQKKGWEPITDALIKAVNEKDERVVFLLWGAFAQKKAVYITNPNHVVLKAVHPSPLSARSGFFGSQPFSKTNDALTEAGLPTIDWRLDG